MNSKIMERGYTVDTSSNELTTSYTYMLDEHTYILVETPTTEINNSGFYISYKFDETEVYFEYSTNIYNNNNFSTNCGVISNNEREEFYCPDVYQYYYEINEAITNEIDFLSTSVFNTNLSSSEGSSEDIILYLQ